MSIKENELAEISSPVGRRYLAVSPILVQNGSSERPFLRNVTIPLLLSLSLSPSFCPSVRQPVRLSVPLFSPSVGRSVVASERGREKRLRKVEKWRRTQLFLLLRRFLAAAAAADTTERARENGIGIMREF